MSAKVRGGRARQSAMAEASRPSTKNVSVKLPRMNAMTSFIEALPLKLSPATPLAHPARVYPHRIAASVEDVVHSSTTAAPLTLSGLAKRPRSYYVPWELRAELRRDVSLALASWV